MFIGYLKNRESRNNFTNNFTNSSRYINIYSPFVVANWDKK